MDANQRSEVNNQTNNVANEKWTPGSKGKTADDGPLDHTYPAGLGSEQMGGQNVDTMGGRQDNQSLEPGGSMQNQVSGGSGTVQGITDSHQRVMDHQKSGAYGVLEEPLGHRPGSSGVDVSPHHAGSAGQNYGAGSMQSASQGGAEAAGGAGDEGGLAAQGVVQAAHGLPRMNDVTGSTGAGMAGFPCGGNA